MTEQKSRLVVEIDSRNAEQKAIDLQKSLDALESAGLRIKPAMDKASTGLDGLNKSGSGAGKSADGAGKAWSSASDGIGKGIQQVVKELQSLNAKQDAAAKLIESFGLSLSKASTSFLDAANSAGRMKSQNDSAAISIVKVGETAAETSARLLAVAKSSLESSDYVRSLSVSTDKAATSFDYAGDKAERLADLARRMRAESDANVKTNNSQTDSVRKAASSTGAYSDELEKLLGKLDPLRGKYSDLAKQQKQLADALKSGELPRAEYEKFGKIIGDNVTALKDFNLTTKGAQRDAAQLLNALKSGDWQGAARNFQQISVSAGGAGSAIQSLGGMAGALINPFTIAAAAVGAFSFAAYKGYEQADQYRNALTLAGNAAGKTSDNLIALSSALAGGRNFLEASDAVLALAGNGRLAGEVFTEVARAATEMAVATGKSASDIADQLSDTKGKVADLAAEYSQKYGVITKAVFEQIQALEEQGDRMGAVKALAGALADEMASRNKEMVESTRGLSKAWDDVKNSIAGAWSELKSGLSASPEMFKLQHLQLQLQKALKLGDKALISGLEQQISLAQEAVDAQVQKVEAASAELQERKELVAADLKWFELSKKEMSDQAKLAKNIADARKLGVEAGRSQAEIDKVVADIQAKYDKRQAKPKVYREDAGQRMLDQARQQFAVLQEQSKVIADQTTGTVTLGAEAKKLIALETTLAELKKKGTLTVAQKQILAMGELNVAQQKLNAGLEKQNQLSAVQLENAARLKAYQDGLNAELNLAQEGLNNKNAGTGLGDRAKARLQEDLKIQQDYQKRINKLTNDYNNSTDKSVGRKQLYDDEVASAKAALDKRLAMQKDSYAKEEELRANWLAGTSDAWQNYVDMAFNYNQQAQDATSQVLGNTTSSISDQIQGLLKGTTNLGNAFLSLGETMGSSILQALSDITARWVVVQALKMAGIDLETKKIVASEGIKTTAKLTTDAASTSSTLAAIATTLAANVAAAATTVASWLPAALVASIGSFGAAAVVGGGALVAAYALLKGFSDGGYTGPGGINEVAGTVHKGEVVWSQKDINRHGGVAMVESLRKGNVSPIGAARAASVQPPAASGAAVTPNMNVQIYNNSNSQVRTKQDQKGQLQVFINAVREDFLAGVASGDSDWATGIERNYTGIRRNAG